VLIPSLLEQDAMLDDQRSHPIKFMGSKPFGAGQLYGDSQHFAVLSPFTTWMWSGSLRSRLKK
jgi:hypothetical protein